MTKRKHIPQLRPGQEVTVGRYGPKLMVLEVDGNVVICFDQKSARRTTYSASQLYLL